MLEIFILRNWKNTNINFIAKKLTNLEKTSYYKKDYKNHSDEHNLIRKHYSELIINKSRSIAISQAETKNYDMLFLMMVFKIIRLKNLNILCFNKNQLIEMD